LSRDDRDATRRPDGAARGDRRRRALPRLRRRRVRHRRPLSHRRRLDGRHLIPMLTHLIRFRDPAGRTGYAAEQSAGPPAVGTGAPSGELTPTGELADISERLAPVEPPAVWAIGLNYRAHAEEAGLPIPQHPVVFAKGVNAVIGPGAPILLPRALRSDRV